MTDTDHDTTRTDGTPTGSLPARRPLTGVVRNLVHGGGHDWLAAARTAMDTPLTVLAALVVVRAFRRTTKRLAA